jgi:hypothetical protein
VTTPRGVLAWVEKDIYFVLAQAAWQVPSQLPQPIGFRQRYKMFSLAGPHVGSQVIKVFITFGPQAAKDFGSKDFDTSLVRSVPVLTQEPDVHV